MKKIALNQNKVVLVDDSDKDGQTFYAQRHIYKTNGVRTTQRMHILLVGKGFDHIDHNGLNNQRSNLRPATVQQNNANRRFSKGVSSYKGVTWEYGKWRARIKVNSKKIHLGLFENEEEAAKAYNTAAMKYFGKFACLNEGVN